MPSRKRRQGRARKARESINSGDDDSSLSSNESDFLPNTEDDPIEKPSVLEMDNKSPRKRLSTGTNSISSDGTDTDLVSNRGMRSPTPNKFDQLAFRREIAASQQERKEIGTMEIRLAQLRAKAKKLAEEERSQRAALALATPKRQPPSKTNNSSLITPQRRTRQTPSNLRTPGNKTPGTSLTTPGKFSLDQYEERRRKEAKESNKKMDDMKSELLAESKQNHLKTRAEIKRNTNADGAKTRKDISAQLSKMQKEYAVNLEQMERNLQRTIMNRLGHPTDIYVRDSTSTSTTAASTVSGEAQVPRRTRYTRKAAQKR